MRRTQVCPNCVVENSGVAHRNIRNARQLSVDATRNLLSSMHRTEVIVSLVAQLCSSLRICGRAIATVDR